MDVHERVVNGPQGQDRVAVLATDERLLIVLADGAGGTSGGELAATLAVGHVRDRAALLSVAQPQTALVDLLYELDEILVRDRDAGHTTIVACFVGPGRIVGASAGDSGAWLISTTEFVDLTEQQVRKPLLGSGEVSIVPFEHDLRVDATVLVASDGLLKYAAPGRIVSTIREREDLELTADKLLDLVRLTSGRLHDDTSLVLARPASAALASGSSDP